MNENLFSNWKYDGHILNTEKASDKFTVELFDISRRSKTPG